MLNFRTSGEQTASIDRWADKQPDKPDRSQAIRRLIDIGLSVSPSSGTHSEKTRAKAAGLAAETIDRHTDPSASPEEQASRKRRLLKGPKEFRGMRRDHPQARQKP